MLWIFIQSSTGGLANDEFHRPPRLLVTLRHLQQTVLLIDLVAASTPLGGLEIDHRDLCVDHHCSRTEIKDRMSWGQSGLIRAGPSG